MGNIRRYFWPVIVVVIALLLLFGGGIVTLYTDWLWFKDLGFERVFTTRLLTQLKVGLLFGVVFFAIIYGNLWYARRIAPPSPPLGLEQQLLAAAWAGWQGVRWGYCCSRAAWWSRCWSGWRLRRTGRSG